MVQFGIKESNHADFLSEGLGIRHMLLSLREGLLLLNIILSLQILNKIQ